MDGKTYFATQLQIVTLGHQIKSLSTLDDYIETAERAAAVETERTDENFLAAKKGLEMILDLARKMKAARDTAKELEVYMSSLPQPKIEVKGAAAHGSGQA